MKMPKWLRGMVIPTLLLWIWALSFHITDSVDEEGLPPDARSVAGVALSVAIATWALADARKRNRTICYDYDTFVYIAWPVMLPVYLFQTRGWRAFITLFCFVVICSVAAAVGLTLTMMSAGRLR